MGGINRTSPNQVEAGSQLNQQEHIGRDLFNTQTINPMVRLESDSSFITQITSNRGITKGPDPPLQYRDSKPFPRLKNYSFLKPFPFEHQCIIHNPKVLDRESTTPLVSKPTSNSASNFPLSLLMTTPEEASTFLIHARNKPL